MNLNIEITETDQVTIVTIAGEVDIYTAPQLKQALLPLTKEEGNRLEIDLGNVGYMDSTGLGVFISVLKSAKAHNSEFKLKNLQDRVERLFTITGLTDIITIQTDKD